MRISDRSSDVCYSDLPSPISSKASENARIQHSHPKPSSNITRKDRITTPCPRDSTLVAGLTHRRAPLSGHGPPEQITLSFALSQAAPITARFQRGVRGFRPVRQVHSCL